MTNRIDSSLSQPLLPQIEAKQPTVARPAPQPLAAPRSLAGRIQIASALGVVQTLNGAALLAIALVGLVSSVWLLVGGSLILCSGVLCLISALRSIREAQRQAQVEQFKELFTSLRLGEQMGLLEEVHDLEQKKCLFFIAMEQYKRGIIVALRELSHQITQADAKVDNEFDAYISKGVEDAWKAIVGEESHKCTDYKLYGEVTTPQAVQDWIRLSHVMAIHDKNGLVVSPRPREEDTQKDEESLQDWMKKAWAVLGTGNLLLEETLSQSTPAAVNMQMIQILWQGPCGPVQLPLGLSQKKITVQKQEKDAFRITWRLETMLIDITAAKNQPLDEQIEATLVVDVNKNKYGWWSAKLVELKEIERVSEKAELAKKLAIGLVSSAADAASAKSNS